MHRDFYSQCSSIGQRNRTPQPICKEFARLYKLQLELRDMMTDTMLRRDYTKDDCLIEWESIVTQCTAAATESFLEKYGDLPATQCLMPSKRANEVLQYAASHALAEMRRLVELRKAGIGCVTLASPSFDLKPTRHKRDVPLSLRESILRESPFCVRCGATPPHAVLHVDHITPLARGGTNGKDNLQVLCRECNIGKGSKSES
jgi:5-methylcytosine-specific restriction endonuclease McrA